MDAPKGGHAFPQNDAAVNRINNEAGMTLRDYFAAKAMQALLAIEQGEHYSVITERSYRIADWMIEKRG